ncbi:exonuclease V [Lipomyces oligophaga]|uniref:exonuclease V n=1 Tax=Lipomyces oligophaga TaxID=45792 RepID=UPI0034CF3E91
MTSYRPQNRLSVSDLVGPLWCELQYFYKLYYQDTAPTPAMKRGTNIHGRLELEVKQPLKLQIKVSLPSREEQRALQLLQMLIGLQDLSLNGITRELHVFGFFNDIYVSGIIDEVTYSPGRHDFNSNIKFDNKSSSSVIKNMSNVFDLSYFSKQRAFQTLDDFEFDSRHIFNPFRVLNQNTLNHSTEDTATFTPEEDFDHDESRIRISDFKTRVSGTLPPENQTIQAYMQMALYRKLFYELASDSFDYDKYCSILFLSPNGIIRDDAVRSIYLDEPNVRMSLEDALEGPGNLGYIAALQKFLTCQPDKLTFQDYVDLVRFKLLDFQDSFTNDMSIIYYSQKTGKPIGGYDYDYDERLVDPFINYMIQFWSAQRDPNGPDSKSKCAYCRYSSHCAWFRSSTPEIE